MLLHVPVVVPFFGELPAGLLGDHQQETGKDEVSNH
jgi:hypothetical protein